MDLNFVTAVADTLPAGQVVPLDTVALATLISIFVPLLVSVITKQTASEGLRSVVNIAASALVTVVALWVNPSDVPVTWQLVLNTFVLSVIASLGAYKGAWKPTGVAGSITAATANFGLDSPQAETESKGAEDVLDTDNNLNVNAEVLARAEAPAPAQPLDNNPEALAGDPVPDFDEERP